MKPTALDGWRTFAACARPEIDPEVMFPDSDVQAIEAARAVCEPCPVRVECLAAAMAEEGGLHRDYRHGVRGGLTGKQRAYRYRARPSAARLPLLPAATQRPSAERTPQNVVADNTFSIDGHLIWNGPASVWVWGRSCSPKTLAFVADRGREPEGQVLGQCGTPDCVLAGHIADKRERTRCGTRPGYQRHLASDEPACDECRRANADADNRLRWTGTTKALA